MWSGSVVANDLSMIRIPYKAKHFNGKAFAVPQNYSSIATFLKVFFFAYMT